MSDYIEENADRVSNAMVFAHIQRNVASMLDNAPAGASEVHMLESGIEQLTARLSFAQSPDVAARHLCGTSRRLKDGRLRM